MAMMVQHNMTAANANRMLGITTGNQAKSAEKLSSGYRINRAGDDAAGLKISEKMRSQIRGLDKASSNCQDGISLIQTAEGALTETHSILQRMNELCVQGANDTNQDIDRGAIQDELDALTAEITRISKDTQFNKQNLLDGTFNTKNLQVGANQDQKIQIDIGAMDASTLFGGLAKEEKVTTYNALFDNKYGTIKAYLPANTSIEYEYNNAKGTGSNKFAMAKSAGQKASNAVTSAMIGFSGGKYYASKVASQGFNTHASALVKAKSLVKAAASNQVVTKWNALTSAAKTEGKAATGLGSAISTTKMVGGVRVDDYQTANASITTVQNAINKVSTQRSQLGALQNRLEHTVANLDNISENTQSAESRIRDTDMASEMVNYSKNNILAQAGQSMLAQGNQATQGVLSLLG